MNELGIPELNSLVTKYPHLFPKHRETGEPSFYFECADGWYYLLDNLFGIINWKYQNWERYSENRTKAEKAGEKIPDYITEYLLEHPMNPLAGFALGQVKEKFGGLRFYVDNCVDDYLDGAIGFAEQMSFLICEICGSPGKCRGRGWLMTRCEEHSKAKG